jgi:GR25 family glycosyltransferase involved in LPS biosynthesis
MTRGKTRRKANINIFNVPAYFINMQERPDRCKRFMDQPAVASLKKLRRCVAVNGKKLKYKTDRRISLRTRLNIFRNYRRSHYEIATLGAIGASLSHIDIWKRFLATGARVALVFEDDAILTEAILNQINTLIPTLPSDWGMWLLGWYKPNLVFEHLDKKPWNRVYNFTAAHAYLLTREAAKNLLEDALPIETHVDHYISTAAAIKDLVVVQHPDVHIEFFRKERGPRTKDSNTSQHKTSGCPNCNKRDDLTQIYKWNTRKSRHGMRVRGLVDGEQSKRILTFKRGATRRNSIHP